MLCASVSICIVAECTSNERNAKNIIAIYYSLCCEWCAGEEKGGGGGEKGYGYSTHWSTFGFGKHQPRKFNLFVPSFDLCVDTTKKQQQQQQQQCNRIENTSNKQTHSTHACLLWL